MGLRREILEECGIEVEGVSFLAEKSLLDRDGYGNVRYHYRIKVFTCFSSRKDVHAQSDAACAEWFDPDQLDSLGLAPDMRKIIDKARRISR